MKKAKTAKAATAATAAKPAKKAKAARVAKAAKNVASMLVMALVMSLGFGCMTQLNRTPVMSESDGETVVAYATVFKSGWINKEATSIGSYELSADGGLKIANLDQKNDQSQVFLAGVQAASAYFNREGAAVGGAAIEKATGKNSPPADVSGTPSPQPPKSITSADGSPLIAVIGNRSSGTVKNCGLCDKFWSWFNPAELSSNLCGVTVIDADMTDNPEAYKKYLPTGRIQFPYVTVYDGTGKLVGQFVGRGYNQETFEAKIAGFVPDACSVQ